MAKPIFKIAVARKKADGSLGFSTTIGAVFENDKGTKTISWDIDPPVNTQGFVFFLNEPKDDKGGQI